jgi:hypothetical protein
LHACHERHRDHRKCSERSKYETAALEPTLSPEWNQDLLLDLVSRLPTEPVVIIVRDGIDGKVVGSTTMTVEALISRDAHTITNIPSVPSLNLRVAATTIHRATFAVVVPGSGQATLDVSGGDVVEIVASNQVCVAPDRCHGPDGDPLKFLWKSRNFTSTSAIVTTTLWEGTHKFALTVTDTRGLTATDNTTIIVRCKKESY